MEKWRDVIGFEDYYEVSSLGRVRSKDRMTGGRGGKLRPANGKVIVQRWNGKPGYLTVGLYVGGRGTRKYVHDLVAEAFNGPKPKGSQTRHRDGDRSRNVPTNLRYATAAVNYADTKLHGTHKLGSQGSVLKLTPRQVGEIRLAKGTKSSHVLGREYGCSQTNILKIWDHGSWNPHEYLKTMRRQIKAYGQGDRGVSLKNIKHIVNELRLVDPLRVCYHKAVNEFEEFTSWI